MNIMYEIKSLLKFNNEKYKLLEKYSLINEKIENILINEKNLLNQIQKPLKEKNDLMRDINFVDNKIIFTMSSIKKTLKIETLEDLKDEYKECFKEIKRIVEKSLKKMNYNRNKDKFLIEKIEDFFENKKREPIYDKLDKEIDDFLRNIRNLE